MVGGARNFKSTRLIPFTYHILYMGRVSDLHECQITLVLLIVRKADK